MNPRIQGLKSTEMSEKVSEKTSEKTSGKTSGKILAAMCRNQSMTILELSVQVGVKERSIERNIRKPQENKQLHRVGSAKGGHWEVLE